MADKNAASCVLGANCLIILAVIAFWIGVAWAVLHFLLKYW